MALSGIWNRVTGGIMALAIGRTAGDATRPVFELVAQDAWLRNPNRVLGLGQLAELVATGLVPFEQAAEHAARQGFEDDRFRAAVQLALETPTIDAALTLRRRGFISDAQLTHVFRKAGLEPQYDDAMRGLMFQPLPISDTIRAAVREVYDPERRRALSLDAEYPEPFTERAQAAGLSETAAREAWAAHWDLPSFEQLAEMRFRGAIQTDAELFEALRAIDIAPVWRERFLKIARRIPTPTDFLRLVRRGVYSDERREFNLDAEYPAVFTEKMALHGMTEQDAKDLWAGGWRLPSAGQLYRMLWRHEITEPQLRAGLKALDYPPFWRDRLANVARPVPPRTAITTMIRQGVLSPAEGHEYFMQLGYTSEDADRLVQIALPGAGGPDEGSSWANRARSRLYTTARDEYLDGSLDDAAADTVLAEIGIPPAERATVLTLWRREWEIRRVELTQAQVVKLYKRTLWTREQALTWLIDHGMTPDDANARLDSA